MIQVSVDLKVGTATKRHIRQKCMKLFRGLTLDTAAVVKERHAGQV